MRLPDRACCAALSALGSAMLLAGAAVAATPALTIDPQQATIATVRSADVVCADFALTVVAPDTQPLASITVDPATFLRQCTSSSGAKLALLAPDAAVTLSLEPQTSQTLRFVVENIGGQEAEASLTVTRLTATAN